MVAGCYWVQTVAQRMLKLTYLLRAPLVSVFLFFSSLLIFITIHTSSNTRAERQGGFEAVKRRKKKKG